MEFKSDAEKLKHILANIHYKGNNGATVQDIMVELKNELPKIIKKIDVAN